MRRVEMFEHIATVDGVVALVTRKTLFHIAYAHGEAAPHSFGGFVGTDGYAHAPRSEMGEMFSVGAADVENGFGIQSKRCHDMAERARLGNGPEARLDRVFP